MAGGAPKGNQNAVKENRLWGDALRRAGMVEDPKAKRRKLELLADKVWQAALEGDMGAAKEIGDRLDGKPRQAVDLGSDPERPLIGRIENVIVDPAA